MVVHENTGGMNPVRAMPEGRQTLVEVTNQLAADVITDQPSSIGQSPQVVFVGTSEPARQESGIGQHIELTVQRRTASQSETSANQLPQNEQATAGQESGSTSDPLEGESQFPAAGSRYIPLPVSTVDEHQSALASVPERSFLIDPFDYADDGHVPVLPSLPVAKAIEMTEKVVSRENAGEHYAWRLQRPYPDLGNTPQDSAGEPGATDAAKEAEAPSNDVQPVVDAQVSRAESETVDWANTEVVTEGDSGQHGDNFYAQPGDVISIDGNQGYDHIDLRSYSIEDAQFQPGAILLTSSIDQGNTLEFGTPEPPIIIRHRGVEFAIFKGEVRVEL